MCGRYNLRLTPTQIKQVFELYREPQWQPRFNIAPSQSVLAIRFEEDRTPREPVLLKWGFLAPWAKDAGAKPQPINAKSESIAGRMWGRPFKKQRCLLPATGFYEWQSRPGESKQPFHITVDNGEPFAFAGLWSRWAKADNAIETCVIITTSANETVRPIHERMPVILHAADYDRWLDPATPVDDLTDLLCPFGGPMQATAISTRVNNVRNESSAVLESE